ncbi:MAG TPA: iron uptake transporter deferrochelatase/peroxidase subunit [Acidimicrobiales bacterium]
MSPDAVSRRRFLGSVGALGVGAASTAALASCSDDRTAHQSVTTTVDPGLVPFHGTHQAGIVTPAQDRMVFAAFDVVTTDRVRLANLLHQWSTSAAAMTAGNLLPGGMSTAEVPPADTGEAFGLNASHLTITLGFGPSLFDHRFGLAAKKPKLLETLPQLPNSVIDDDISGGDLCIQACADDPQVAFHAVRNLARQGIGTITNRWLQVGFGRTSSTSTSQATPRNLLGFKDGTNNLKSEEHAAVSKFVWVPEGSDQAWMDGGSYLVARKIAMHLETWDADTLGDQEAVIGRQKDTGAPIGEASEFAKLDLSAKGPDGAPLVPADSHVRLASPEANGGIQILRRGYNYTDGIDPALGNIEAGLFFICFVNDPNHFIKVQTTLGRDGLNEYIQHISSSLFACPPGVAKGKTWRDHLF